MARRARTCVGDGGFTLIEVMVALAVFSIAALALVRLQAFTIRSAGAVEARTMARIVAQNLLVEATTDPAPPTLGRSEGQAVNGGRAWRWVRIVSRPGDVRLLRIDVAVGGTGAGADGASARLTAIRPVQL